MMKWYAEIEEKSVELLDESDNPTGKVEQCKNILMFYKGGKRISKNKENYSIEISNPPKDFNYQPWYEVDFTDETKTDVEWKVDRDMWLNEYVRPTREPLMEKALNKIDQYKNETEQLDYSIITERSLSDTKYQEWLTYLQDLRDITDTIEYGNEQWPEEPI